MPAPHFKNGVNDSSDYIAIDGGAWLRDALERDDFSSFASQCVAWKRRGVCIVLPLDPQNLNTHATLRHALELCAAQKLSVWLRIEYRNIEYSMSRQSYLTYQNFDVSRGATALFDRADEVVSAIAVAKVEGDFPNVVPRLVWSKTRDITSDFAAHAVRGFRDVTDDWGQARLYLWARASENRFDALDKNATQNLISSIRNALNSLLETSELRAAIHGMVLDVPSLWDETSPDAMRRFPWHIDLPQIFKTLHGSDLQGALPSLIADTGSDAVRVRLNFWASVSQMLHDNFAQPWRDFADENKVKLRLDFVADNLNHTVARYGDVTQVANVADGCALFIDIINSEIDNITSSTRCLLRLFSSIGEARANPFKVFARCTSATLPQTHALLHAGANAFETAHDSGDASNAELLAEYVARNCDLLTAGKSACRVAILWPGRSLHAHHHPKAHRFVRWVEEDLLATMHLLDALHFDFSFCLEGEIVDAKIEDRVLDLGAKTPLECVVLPTITCLSRAVWRKLEAFAQAGGKVVCLGLLPRWSELGRDEELEREVETQTRTNIEDAYNFYKHEEHESLNDLHQSDPSSVGYPVVRQTASGGRVSTYQPRLNPDGDDARLRVRGLLTESVTPELETQSVATRHRVRIDNAETRFWTWHDDALSGRAHLVMRSTAQDAMSLSCFNLWRDSDVSSGRHLGNKSSTRSLSSGEKQPCSVWMRLPQEEGGGVAFMQEYAGDEVRAFALRCGSQLHLEDATFVVEKFDEMVARGYATQSGVPSIAWRDGGRLQRRFGEPVHVASPIMLSEDWNVSTFDAHIEYSMQVALPQLWREQWNHARVWLQVVPIADCSAVEAQIGDAVLGRRLAAPWRFEVENPHANDLEITLRFWKRQADETKDSDFPVARLALYPRLKIALGSDERTPRVSDGLNV